MKELKLTNGMIAFVDDECFDICSKYVWYPCKGRNTYYATCLIGADKKNKDVRLHWLVIGKPAKGFLVDHVDGNGLNNQKQNLRICTNKENSCNRTAYGASNYLGVCKVSSPRTKTIKWRAAIGKVYLGSFGSESEAAMAYNKAASNKYGQFAKLNKF